MSKSGIVFKHKEKIEYLYENPKYNDAIDLWASFFAESEDDIIYSNWRYLNRKRQEVENSIWKEYLKDEVSILDIACGRGYFLKRINDILRRNVKSYGLDISLKVINFARDFCPSADYVVSSAEDIPFRTNCFDYVQIIAALEHVISSDRVIKEAYRVLKPEGLLYIVIHKRAIDPLIFPTLYQVVMSRLRKKINNKNNETSTQRFSSELSGCRKEVFNALEDNNMVLIRKGYLLGHAEVSFYKRIGLSYKWYRHIAGLANKLPFGIFKNLEYYLYRKEE